MNIPTSSTHSKEEHLVIGKISLESNKKKKLVAFTLKTISKLKDWQLWKSVVSVLVF